MFRNLVGILAASAIVGCGGRTGIGSSTAGEGDAEALVASAFSAVF